MYADGAHLDEYILTSIHIPVQKIIYHRIDENSQDFSFSLSGTSISTFNTIQELFLIYHPNVLAFQTLWNVKATNLIHLAGITKTSISTYECLNVRKKEPWALMYGRKKFIEGLSCFEIGLYKGHCFYIKHFGQLVQLWTGLDCQQNFNEQHNRRRHSVKVRCIRGKTKPICTGKKLRSIISLSKRVLKTKRIPVWKH